MTLLRASAGLAFCLFFSLRPVFSAPLISSVSPPPGLVNELASISVVFSEPVTGVRAVDFLVNGVPARSVTGNGASYTFEFSPPAFGGVDITWGTLHTITDLQSPAQRFDGGAAGSTWAYQLINPAGPSVTSILPVPGIILRKLGAVEVTFTEPVSQIDAADLLLNGVAATNLTGVGAGPYRFSFPEAAAGEVVFTWAPNHGMTSDSVFPVAFTGSSWRYSVNPSQPLPDIVINEIMTENQSGIVDEEKDPEDWIELFNRGSQPVDLAGWSLSVDREEDGQWIFPPAIVLPGEFLVVWASGKDRRSVTGANRLHTHFKLNPHPDTLTLFGPELPRAVIDEVSYPEQAPNYSYGRQAGQNAWKFLSTATPGAPNVSDILTGKVDEVHFSVERGFFNAPFNLTLACSTPQAQIRYTTNGSPPNATNGTIYAGPIPISTTRIIRAAAFAPKQLPSRVRSHTYLMNLASTRRLLPVLSLVTDTNNLYGRTGIMESSPRNTTKHGPLWERPVSVELIRPEDNGGFQLEAGLRVAGGDYIRERYNYRTTTPPEGKYSFRLYFRGDYGAGRLKYPIFPGSTLESFNTLHLRAGMNDPTNPFVKDEFVRRLSLDVGIPACHGTFVYLFLNGVYKGLYNPAERVDDDFLQAYHGGGEKWDVMGPNNAAIRGDATAWNQLRTVVRRDLTITTNYLEVAARMDLANFIDYLLPLVWADNDDWPHNNTRAAREKVAGARFRFYPWDAEFSFTSHGVSYDTIATTLSTLSPPWGTTDYQAMFNSLKKSPEFRLLFADRVHRAFFNDGPLTDARIRARYNEVKAQAAPAIPGFSDVIGSWISGRRRYVTNSFAKAGFLASSNAPVASQFGGRVPVGYSLKLTNLTGQILYTTNGVDPRVAFANAPSDSAIQYTAPIVIAAPLHLTARSLQGTNWSAVIDLFFDVTQISSPVRISEIMYNPPGGDAFEFIELLNSGELPADISGFSFDAIDFRFPTPFPWLAPGARIVLANSRQPVEFQRRYPFLKVAGWFEGALSNGGERIALYDLAGRIVTSVDYADGAPWPVAADGFGSSLEVIDAAGDPDDPANWQASVPAGTPGKENGGRIEPLIRLNEFQAGAARDWVELFNPGAEAVALEGWSLTDNTDPRRFVFPPGARLEPGGYLRVDCVENGNPGPSTALFALNRDGETIALFNDRTNRIDIVSYGPVVDGYTMGLVNGAWVLTHPSPLAPNQPLALGSLSTVRINEFLADPDAGDDWIELHNTGEAPVALQGCFIATSNAIARIERTTFIPENGFVVLRADGNAGSDHLKLKLPAHGGLISLLAPNGEELDRVIYGLQSIGVSFGRLPDGHGIFQRLPYSPTRGGSNYLAVLGAQLRISEVMARSLQGPSWIELENVSTQAITLSAFTVGVREPGLPDLALPLNSASPLAPGARFVVSPPRDLSLAGGELTVRDSLGRIIDRVAYGLQIPGRSIGRIDRDWALLAAATPGDPNGAAAPLDSGFDLRLNEWLAAGAGTNDFVEIYNPSRLPVHLGGWVLTDDPSIYGSTNNRISPLCFIDAGAFARFYTDSAPRTGANHTAFGLDQFGETIRLLNATGQIVDTIDFSAQREAVSEGRYPDGGALIVRFPGSSTPGAANALPRGDYDSDGLDDAWEALNGLDSRNPSDALEDLDGDGFSNFQEFRRGTNPRDPTSVFELKITAEKAGEANLHFVAQAGRIYAVEFSSQLGTPNWTRLTEIIGSEVPREITLPGPRQNDQQNDNRFYRVLLVR